MVLPRIKRVVVPPRVLRSRAHDNKFACACLTLRLVLALRVAAWGSTDPKYERLLRADAMTTTSSCVGNGAAMMGVIKRFAGMTRGEERTLSRLMVGKPLASSIAPRAKIETSANIETSV